MSNWDSKKLKSLLPSREKVARLIKAKSRFLSESSIRTQLDFPRKDIYAFIITTISISSMRSQESRCSFVAALRSLVGLRNVTSRDSRCDPTHRLSYRLSRCFTYVTYRSERGRAWGRALNNSHVLAAINMQYGTVRDTPAPFLYTR